MKINIRDLMENIEDSSVDLEETNVVSSERIKELTKMKINELGVAPKRKSKKTIITVLIAVAVVSALTLSVCALAGCGQQADNNAAQDGAKHFAVATDKGFSPFEFQDAAGNIVGIDMDILAAIAEDQGFTYDLQYVGWDSAIAACQAGQADGVIAGMSITDERKEKYNFSDAYYDSGVVMAIAANNTEITKYEDLKGKIALRMMYPTAVAALRSFVAIMFCYPKIGTMCY